MANRPFMAQCTNAIDETVFTSASGTIGTSGVIYTQSVNRKVIDTTLTCISGTQPQTYTVGNQPQTPPKCDFFIPSGDFNNQQPPPLQQAHRSFMPDGSVSFSFPADQNFSNSIMSQHPNLSNSPFMNNDQSVPMEVDDDSDDEELISETLPMSASLTPGTVGANNVVYRQAVNRKVIDTALTSIGGNQQQTLPRDGVFIPSGDFNYQQIPVLQAQPRLMLDGSVSYTFPPVQNFPNLLLTETPNFSSGNRPFVHQQCDAFRNRSQSVPIQTQFQVPQFSRRSQLNNQEIPQNIQRTSFLLQEQQKEKPFTLTFHLHRATSTSDFYLFQDEENNEEEEMAECGRRMNSLRMWQDLNSTYANIYKSTIHRRGVSKELRPSRSPETVSENGNLHDADVACCKSNILQKIQVFENKKVLPTKRSSVPEQPSTTRKNESLQVDVNSDSSKNVNFRSNGGTQTSNNTDLLQALLQSFSQAITPSLYKILETELNPKQEAEKLGDQRTTNDWQDNLLHKISHFEKEIKEMLYSAKSTLNESGDLTNTRFANQKNLLQTSLDTKQTTSLSNSVPSKVTEGTMTVDKKRKDLGVNTMHMAKQHSSEREEIEIMTTNFSQKSFISEEYRLRKIQIPEKSKDRSEISSSNKENVHCQSDEETTMRKKMLLYVEHLLEAEKKSKQIRDTDVPKKKFIFDSTKNIEEYSNNKQPKVLCLKKSPDLLLKDKVPKDIDVNQPDLHSSEFKTTREQKTCEYNDTRVSGNKVLQPIRIEVNLSNGRKDNMFRGCDDKYGKGSHVITIKNTLRTREAFSDDAKGPCRRRLKLDNLNELNRKGGTITMSSGNKQGNWQDDVVQKVLHLQRQVTECLLDATSIPQLFNKNKMPKTHRGCGVNVRSTRSEQIKICINNIKTQTSESFVNTEKKTTITSQIYQQTDIGQLQRLATRNSAEVQFRIKSNERLRALQNLHKYEGETSTNNRNMLHTNNNTVLPFQTNVIDNRNDSKFSQNTVNSSRRSICCTKANSFPLSKYNTRIQNLSVFRRNENMEMVLIKLNELKKLLESYRHDITPLKLETKTEETSTSEIKAICSLRSSINQLLETASKGKNKCKNISQTDIHSSVNQQHALRNTQNKLSLETSNNPSQGVEKQNNLQNEGSCAANVLREEGQVSTSSEKTHLPNQNQSHCLINQRRLCEDVLREERGKVSTSSDETNLLNQNQSNCLINQRRKVLERMIDEVSSSHHRSYHNRLIATQNNQERGIRENVRRGTRRELISIEKWIQKEFLTNDIQWKKCWQDNMSDNVNNEKNKFASFECNKKTSPKDLKQIERPILVTNFDDKLNKPKDSGVLQNSSYHDRRVDDCKEVERSQESKQLERTFSNKLDALHKLCNESNKDKLSNVTDTTFEVGINQERDTNSICVDKMSSSKLTIQSKAKMSSHAIQNLNNENDISFNKEFRNLNKIGEGMKKDKQKSLQEVQSLNTGNSFIEIYINKELNFSQTEVANKDSFQCRDSVIDVGAGESQKVLPAADQPKQYSISECNCVLGTNQKLKYDVDSSHRENVRMGSFVTDTLWKTPNTKKKKNNNGLKDSALNAKSVRSGQKETVSVLHMHRFKRRRSRCKYKNKGLPLDTSQKVENLFKKLQKIKDRTKRNESEFKDLSALRKGSYLEAIKQFPRLFLIGEEEMNKHSEKIFENWVKKLYKNTSTVQNRWQMFENKRSIQHMWTIDPSQQYIPGSGIIVAKPLVNQERLISQSIIPRAFMTKESEEFSKTESKHTSKSESKHNSKTESKQNLSVKPVFQDWQHKVLKDIKLSKKREKALLAEGNLLRKHGRRRRRNLSETVLHNIRTKRSKSKGPFLNKPEVLKIPEVFEIPSKSNYKTILSEKLSKQEINKPKVPQQEKQAQKACTNTNSSVTIHDTVQMEEVEPPRINESERGNNQEKLDTTEVGIFKKFKRINGNTSIYRKIGLFRVKKP